MDHRVVASLAAAPTRRSGPAFRWVALIMGACVIGALAVLPFARVPGPHLPAITSVFVAAIVTAELSTSFLLFVRFQDARTWSLLILAAAYLFGGVMAAVHLLTFPGALLPGTQPIGVAQSTAWTYLFWLDGYAALTLLSVVLEACLAEHPIPRQAVSTATALAVVAALALAVACALLAVTNVHRLPNLMRGEAWTIFNQAANDIALGMIASGMAIALLVLRNRDGLFLWLSLALCCLLLSNILSLIGGARYTVGWSVGRAVWFVSSITVFLFFMGQFATQQRLLARAKDTLEQRVAERTAELSKTIGQRDVLLREVYHRVKNNLQVVDSLVALEERRIDDPAARELLTVLRDRVFSLGLAHQQLMSSADLQTFDVAPFLRELTENLAAGLGAADRGIVLVIDIDPVMVNLDLAIPLGLITTELVSNAIKYAGASLVSVTFKRAGHASAVLAVGDDGKGAAPDGADVVMRAGAGGRIIAGLARQLDGRIGVFHEHGTRVEITMPLPATA
jgi:two-component sensor histidine kinase